MRIIMTIAAHAGNVSEKLKNSIIIQHVCKQL